MNIREIARIADVTPGTVSKVLNNYPDVGEATRKHVLEIIEEYQYAPKVSPRRKGKAIPKIGLVTEGVYNPLYSHIEDMLSILIHNSGYLVLGFHDNYHAQDKTEKMTEMIRQLNQEKLSGLIYIGGNFAPVPREVFRQLPCPAIFINTVLPEQEDELTYSSIQVSHFQTAFGQMKSLIDQGHQNICTVISSFIDNSVYGLRVQAYQAALRMAGNETNWYIETDYQYQKTYDGIKVHFLNHPETTAVCCVSDTMVPAILRALHDLKIPAENVKILSFDGLESVAYCIPSVTTFAQPVADMVKHTAQLMKGLILQEQNHQHVTFQPLLMRRESC